MRGPIFSYGGLAGLITILAMIIGMTLTGHENIQFAEILGYLFMLAALSVIFVGIKRYRDRELGGVIRFKTATKLGLGMVLIASVMYVIVWEINLAATDYAFISEYTESVINARAESGGSEAELAELRAEMADMEAQYANPLYRLPITFLEIFPVGLLIVLLSAFLLKNSRFLPAESQTVEA